MRASYSMKILMLSFITIFFFYVTATKAAHPYCTDDASVIPDQSFELEGSGSSSFWGNASGSFSIKYGIANRFDAGILFGAVYPVDTAHTLTPPSLGLKFALIPNIFTIKASSALAEKDFSLIAIWSGGSKNVAVNGNMGFASTVEERALLVYSFSVIRCLGDVHVGGEIFGDYLHSPFWQLGCSYSFRMPLIASLGFGGNFVSHHDLSATLGLTLSIVNDANVKKDGKK